MFTITYRGVEAFIHLYINSVYSFIARQIRFSVTRPIIQINCGRCEALEITGPWAAAPSVLLFYRCRSGRFEHFESSTYDNQQPVTQKFKSKTLKKYNFTCFTSGSTRKCDIIPTVSSPGLVSKLFRTGT